MVTGAGGVLGAAVARVAASRGARVALVDLNEPADLGPGHMRLGGVDLTSLESAQRAMDAVQAAFGRLDALLNIAGAFAGRRWATAGSTPGTSFTA